MNNDSLYLIYAFVAGNLNSVVLFLIVIYAVRRNPQAARARKVQAKQQTIYEKATKAEARVGQIRKPS